MGLFKKKKDLQLPSKPSEEEVKGPPNFDKILAEVPPPPQEGEVKGKELPTFELAQKPGAQPRSPDQMVEEGFELPDFGEEEIKELEGIKAVSETVEKKPGPVKPIKYPEPVKLVIIPKEKFVDIKDYLNTKEDLDKTGMLATTIGRMIKQHAVTSKAKDEKYRALIIGLNTIQDKLILIDNKLFEST